MEHNRDAIIKALECLTGEEVMFCRECGYNKVGAFSCRKELAKDALALINELTEENERLQKALNTDISIVRVRRGSGKTAHLREVGRIKVDAIRADTVRLMQGLLNNRIKDKISYHGWYLKETIIPDIAKEILEGGTDG